ncbi:hypothetical protein [Mucilaginibacter sp.]
METTTLTPLLKAEPIQQTEQLTYNECVHRTYKLILLWATAAIATIDDDKLRGTLIREDALPITEGSIIHELISPILYLRLECYAGNEYGIRFGYEPSPSYGQYYPIMAAFVRMIYKLTSKKASQVNIENAVRIYHIQVDCADLYDWMQEIVSRYHRHEQIPYKAATLKRKLQKVA